KTVYQKTAPHWLLPNTSGYGSADAIIQNTGAEYVEFALRPLAQSWSRFLDVAAHVSHVRGLNATPPLEVLDSYPRNQDGSPPAAGVSRLRGGLRAFFHDLPKHYAKMARPPGKPSASPRVGFNRRLFLA